jgi:predicted SAM-dependent methyltransferase
MKHYFKQFAEIIDNEMEIDPIQSKRIHDLLGSISGPGIETFDHLYDLLGFRYVVNPQGTLDQFNDASFDLIVSSGVLEHVVKNALPDLFKDFFRLLKPGGFSIHHIVIADHLAMHDPSVSRKNYLKYPDRVWKRCFENQIQYFNRVQRPEWLCLFDSAGLELVEEFPWTEGIGPIKVDQQYIDLTQKDLECTVLKLVHQKPPS